MDDTGMRQSNQSFFVCPEMTQRGGAVGDPCI